jgi:hypothetical protein
MLLRFPQQVTPAIAARLGRYFQVPALWFLEMQATYDAERVSADPAMAEGVIPRPRDRNFLLTPGGARPLGARSSKPSEPLRIPYDAFDRNAPAPVPTPHVVRQVEYEGGAVALVCAPK